jgi:hypothetical protein
MNVTAANSFIEPPIDDSERAEKNISSDTNHDTGRPRAGK